LLGKDDERIRKFGHDKISTFGIGAEYNRVAWLGIVRQLVSQSLLYVDNASHHELKITAAGAEFLKQKQTLFLRLEEKTRMSSRKRLDASAQTASAAITTDADQQLLQALKNLRMKLAREQNLPPYVIFHDKTLVDMVTIKPANRDQLALVNGVGNSKLQKYGDAFLQVINEFV
jgi:ATP-dependent DNA helicase RecQ